VLALISAIRSISYSPRAKGFARYPKANPATEGTTSERAILMCNKQTVRVVQLPESISVFRQKEMTRCQPLSEACELPVVRLARYYSQVPEWSTLGDSSRGMLHFHQPVLYGKVGHGTTRDVCTAG
jgi:hypothetical protein